MESKDGQGALYTGINKLSPARFSCLRLPTLVWFHTLVVNIDSKFNLDEENPKTLSSPYNCSGLEAQAMYMIL